MLGIHLLDEPPFETVYLHGGPGRDRAKMSKTVSNVVDPLDAIDEIGADALRLRSSMASPGNDQKLSRDKLENARNWEQALECGARAGRPAGIVPAGAPATPDGPTRTGRSLAAVPDRGHR